MSLILSLSRLKNEETVLSDQEGGSICSVTARPHMSAKHMRAQIRQFQLLSKQ